MKRPSPGVRERDAEVPGRELFRSTGDFASATETTTGENNLTVAGHGIVLHNSGRVVGSADGTIEFRAGKQDFIDYFVNGDTSVMDEVCAALAS